METPEEAVYKDSVVLTMYGLPDTKQIMNEGGDEDAAPPIPKRPRPQRATSEDFDTDIPLGGSDSRFSGRIQLDAVLDRDGIEFERLMKKIFAQRMSEKEKDKI